MPSVPAYGWDKRIRKPWTEQGDKVHCADTREQTLSMIQTHQEMCQKFPIALQILSSLAFLTLSLSWRFAEIFVLNNSPQILCYVLNDSFNLGISIQQICTLRTSLLKWCFSFGPQSIICTFLFPFFSCNPFSLMKFHLFVLQITHKLSHWLKTEDWSNSSFYVFLNKSDSVDW